MKTIDDCLSILGFCVVLLSLFTVATMLAALEWVLARECYEFWKAALSG